MWITTDVCARPTSASPVVPALVLRVHAAEPGPEGLGDQENLERLAEAFDALEAGTLTADEPGTWFPRHPVENWAQYDTLHLMTKHGPLDIVFTPDGAPRGYEDLAPGSGEHTVETADTRALVISVSTWEHLKYSAGRAKDLEHLDLFYEM